ncbi:UDP-N-acetyl-alpha-D-glucosamine C6 dehydratase [Roseovarius litorisediminis]|uniref:UDP-N-acetyl-alpha-D-glucosamine C6 dehydratase n=1 Tax=Roseovarius litorisediminis TaxID=1312363 RepID=A0A1Y5R9M2_9RHOB|nr:nucleoside-diphosphate sugar epimerase/dehydratase [Roseovarius litorisediminis]SLN11181.1 UDP-N-acetyl-alpha-D-glucosamine C6 dehydratase [Roseovarius litorisediminis]
MLYNLAISLSRSQKRTIILFIDVLLIAVAYLLASLLLYGLSRVSPFARPMFFDLAVLLGVGANLIAFLGLHKIKLNAYQMQGVIESALVAVVLVATGAMTSLLIASIDTPVQVYVVTGMLYLILTVMARLTMRQALLQIYRRGTDRTNLLIYGAGQTGQQLASALATDDTLLPVAFIDDDPRLQSLTIAGLRVHPPAEIDDLITKYDVARIVLAMPSAGRAVQSNITQRLAKTGIEVHVMPSFSDLISKDAKALSDTHPIDFNDLLGRERLEEELPGVSDAYRNRCILVTGAGGSIGSELCRQIVSCRPSSLVMVDHGEHSLFQIDRELRALAPDIDVNAVLGSVTDKSLMSAVLKKWDVDIILHAAAYKHVPLVESNAIEGMRNNVFGTKVMAEAAREAGVERFILVSTDKAVRPSSVMGASKRFAELVVQDLATRSPSTRFSMVRFGNVLGSSGSVIPLFAEQIAAGGPVTLTHADVTRYFMTIPEAVRLVLLAGSFARGGDLFVLDMGEPVPVLQVAKQMITGAGLTVRDDDTPDGDIEIEITGLRPGEKLHEELLIGSDMLTTPHAKIMRAQEDHLSEIELAKALKALREAIDARSPDLLTSTLARWIEKFEKPESATVNE